MAARARPSTVREPRSQLVVGILVGPLRRPFDIAVTREVFADRSDRGVPPCETRILAAQARTRLDAVTVIERTHALTMVNDLDLLVVPGSEAPLDEVASDEVAVVQAAVDAAVTVAGLCTGTFTLAAAGVLDGRSATTHWRHADELARRHPAVAVRANELYCGGDGVWTSAGVTAGIDLLLHLVRAEWGASAAEIVARSMVTPAYRPGSQAQFADTAPAEAGDPSIDALTQAVLADLGRSWSVTDLASVSAQSPRTFHRWFRRTVGTTPNVWLNDVRVRAAQRLLEETDLPVGRVAAEVGYASDDLLRRHFAARLRTTPTRHRAAFTPARQRVERDLLRGNRS